MELINQAIKKLFYRKYKFISIDRRGWIFRIYWLGWTHINLGISLYLRAPNIEIHLPFCFIRAGIDNVNTYNENRGRTGRCVMKGLKPCPFNCGNTLIAIGRDSTNKVYMICTNCDARGPIAYTVDEAKELWNRRTE